MNHFELSQVATMSAGPLLAGDSATLQPIDFKYSATTYSASLPNLLHEYKQVAGPAIPYSCFWSQLFTPRSTRYICDGKGVRACRSHDCLCSYEGRTLGSGQPCQGSFR